jgi:hypothetical protein
MQKISNTEVYDLAVIGNGIAAQSFLWNLSLEESKSQNFSIAHIYSEKLAPACTLRSSATVSLNGIDEDVSTLGNDMREAFFLFDELFKKHRPDGVEEVSRTVVSTNENDTKKLTRRYKTLKKINSDRINTEFDGTEYNSYIITPEIFTKWLRSNTQIKKDEFLLFFKNLEKKDDLYHLILEDGKIIKAKKILFAMGAYSKIFEKFFAPAGADSIEVKNTIKAGSYFEKNVDLGPKSFYLSIDGHQVLYRKNSYESKLIIGSATTIGAYEAPDYKALGAIFKKMQPLLIFDLGKMNDFKILTGLRHKGPKRLLICESIDQGKTLFRINGLYKNGYSMGFLASKRMFNLIFKG